MKIKVAPAWGPPWLHAVAAVLGTIYLASVWLDASGTGIPGHVLPRPALFFVQESALFPRSQPMVIEWRAEGWLCDEQRFAEIDVRPFFPIRRDDKESRFVRAMFFHFQQRKVMAALADYVTRRQNLAHPEQRIGGVMLLSLRVPIPPPGSPVERFHRIPLADYPPNVARKYWFVTASDDRARRCTEAP
jgi:hypothetical protein